MNEIEGVITDSDGKVVHSIFGKWHESVFQGDPPSATCIWRASEFLKHGLFKHILYERDMTAVHLYFCV